MRYVIVGNSAAAIGAVEGIRQKDKCGLITIVSQEAHFTYSRPLISYLLKGVTTLEKMRYRPDDFYETNHCVLLSGVRCEKVDQNKKTISISNGQVLCYDKLLVATGSSPFLPTIAGVEKAYTFQTLDDALALDKVLTRDKRVLILGAGLIGLKCAEGIKDRVQSVTVADIAPRVLSSILDDEAAAKVQKHLEKNGITFMLSNSIQEVKKDKAIMNSGAVFSFDILVIAIGVRPNTALLKGFAEIDKGILVNSRSETSCPDVFAAGDCTQSMDVSSGDTKIMALLPNAYLQGECAGINMAGGNKVFDAAIPMNAISFYGMHVMSAGIQKGAVYTSDDGGYKRLYYSDNKLNGFVLIDSIDKAGIYTTLVKKCIPLDSINFDLICHIPGLMAFEQKVRNEILGGVKG